MFWLSNIQGRPTPTLFEKKGGSFVLFQRFAVSGAAFASGLLRSVVVDAPAFLVGTVPVSTAFLSSQLRAVIVGVSGMSFGSDAVNTFAAFGSSTLAVVVRAIADSLGQVNAGAAFLSSLLLVVTKDVAAADPMRINTSTSFLSSSLV